MFGFLSGLSMFSPSVALLSIAAHSAAAVSLAYFALDVWDCNLVCTYWLHSSAWKYCGSFSYIKQLFKMVRYDISALSNQDRHRLRLWNGEHLMHCQLLKCFVFYSFKRIISILIFNIDLKFDGNRLYWFNW